jgi:hypothetical protein
MSDLVAWLRERLDEDERAWEMVAARDVAMLLLGEPLAPRMLAEVAAKRAILDLHEPYESERVGGQSCWACNRDGWPCETVRLLAQPFAGRPGWREEWAS